MKKKLLTLLLFAPLSLFAQIAGTINGVIIEDETDEPLPFVTIALTPEGGSAPTAGCSTGEDGSYSLNNIKAGKYTVTASFVGYLDESRSISITAGKSSINLGTIRLKSDRKLLKEVVVTEQRSQMSFEIDKRVFTVDQSLATTGGSASDVLAEIPSVEVDNEGTVSLRGSESVTVWINGKANGLTGDNQGDILQQLPAGSIEKIEVITNPSAKHSPEGTAGIINIILKRDRKAGYYGSAQGGMDSKLGYNAGGNFNYSSGKFDAYVGFNYRNMRFENEGITDTKYFASNQYQQQTNIGSHNPNNIFGRAGFTWHITRNDDIYANVTGMFGGGRHNNEISAVSGPIGSDGTYADPTQKMTRTTTQQGKPTMYNVELGYTHRWSDTHFIDFSVGHHQWSQLRNSTYRQTTELFGPETKTISSYQFQDGKNRNNSTEIKLDYEYKINENHRIEAGYKGDIKDDRSPVITFTDEAHTQYDKKQYNQFRYKQNIQALYSTYSGRIGKFGYQLGLRGEYWNVKTQSYGWEEKESGDIPGFTSKNFFKLFPSAFVSYEISDGQEVQLNYTRRLRRPWGGQLNNFQNISDSTNISFGNPGLTPEYSNAYEVNYLKNWEDHTLSLSGYYRTTEDVIERISYSSGIGRVIYTTFENVARTQSAGLEIVGKNRLFKALDLTTTVNLFYYKLDAFKYIINGETITGNADENFSWNARMTANVMLPWGISFQATGRYDAKRIVAQGYREPSYSLDLGLRKMFNQHWSISVNARDILDSRGRKTITANDSFYRYSENSHGGRRFGFTLTYNFGNMKAKKPNPKQMQEMQTGGGYDEMGGMGEM